MMMQDFLTGGMCDIRHALGPDTLYPLCYYIVLYPAVVINTSPLILIAING